MAVVSQGGWWYVRFTHNGERWNINTMMRGDNRRPEAEEYERRLRDGLSSGHERKAKTIYLVSCVSRKLDGCRPAEELYISDWFTKAARYVKGSMQPGDLWFILSAKYHLVPPRRPITSYDETLNGMTPVERISWSAEVLRQIKPFACSGDSVIVLAGERYRESLIPGLLESGCIVTVPMQGMGIGKQLRWMKISSRQA